jgi:hypothetical protein
MINTDSFYEELPAMLKKHPAAAQKLLTWGKERLKAWQTLLGY